MTTGKQFIVAVDGPAGSGKSSICNYVAEKLDFYHFNSGSVYRAFAYMVKTEGTDIQKPNELRSALEKFSSMLNIDYCKGGVCLDGIDISPMLGNPDLSSISSEIASLSEVRESLLPLQQSIVRESSKNNIIVDGRDIGTVVFTNASLKIFMTAEIKARAKRRLEQLKNKDDNRSIDDIERSLRVRDQRDQGRQIAPLKKAKDALEIDTSDLSFEETAEKIISLIHRKLTEKKG